MKTNKENTVSKFAPKKSSSFTSDLELISKQATFAPKTVQINQVARPAKTVPTRVTPSSIAQQQSALTKPSSQPKQEKLPPLGNNKFSSWAQKDPGLNDLDDLLLDNDFMADKPQEPSVKINVKKGNGTQ